jgi:hypothetical protein
MRHLIKIHGMQGFSAYRSKKEAEHKQSEADGLQGPVGVEELRVKES